MRPHRSSPPRALALITLGLSAIAGACGGSASPKPVEVDIGGEPGASSDGQVKRTEKPDGDADADRANSNDKAASQKPAQEPEPGYLTLVCDPPCTDIAHEGRSLGPSPVVSAPLAPGSRRITLTTASSAPKIITVILKSGETNALHAQIDGPAGPLHLYPLPTATAAVAPPTPQPPPIDVVAQRARLEPKVWAGAATEEEIKVLRAICTYMGDLACRDRAAALLKKPKPQAPPSASP